MKLNQITIPEPQDFDITKALPLLGLGTLAKTARGTLRENNFFDRGSSQLIFVSSYA